MPAVKRETDVTDAAVTESLQVAAAASQTDEDVTISGAVFLVSLGEMIFHFLAHTIDITCINLIDKLASKDIISNDERQKIKELNKTDAKVNSLLMMIREKSASEFESFLTTLSETGQQSVADVVRQALHTVGQTGHNPLQYVPGKTTTTYSGKLRHTQLVTLLCQSVGHGIVSFSNVVYYTFIVIHQR